MLAHAANNMINDYFDLEGGVDTDDYVRALYAPHPILSGWVTKRQLGAAILIVNAIDLAIMLYLDLRSAARSSSRSRSAGLFISVFYVAPPIRLKHHGLGEPGVFIVWGPLMIGGTFFVATGTIPGWVWIASLPYAILVTTVLFGKHIDKIEADTKQGRPDAAGHPRRARGPGSSARVLMIAFYPIVLGAVARRLDRAVGRCSSCSASRGSLAVLQGVRPAEAGRRRRTAHVGWPLWFVGAAFIHTRRAGGLLVLGLLLNALLPITLRPFGA